MKKTFKKIAYSFVIADLFHYGHLKILKTAKEHADYHICGIVSDQACHFWQGMNICNYDERESVIKSLDCVDEVMKQDSLDPTENLKAIHKRFPRSQIVVIHGNDWKTMPGKDYIESIKGRVIQPEYYARLSRKAIIDKFTHSAYPDHPLTYEYFNRHFSIGRITQFDSKVTNPLISTKAQTLKNFGSLLKLSKIEDLFIFTVGDFKKHANDIVMNIRKQFAKRRLVVRSSSYNEDCYSASNAGCFESVNNVNPANQRELVGAINKVIVSYERKGSLELKDQVLVQPMTENVKKSGVVLTRDLKSNTPYYLINYDDAGSQTDTVTGGCMNKALWIWRGVGLLDCPPGWRKLLAVVREIEGHLPGMILDIEFAETITGEVIIYQIRPLAANARIDETKERFFDALLKGCIQKYENNPERISGTKAFLSDMAFWNPSEIVGDNPHPLDYSLYREIITKDTWNSALIRLGYARVNYELMERYGNKPYINLDYAFYALMPAGLKQGLKKKLNKFYKSKLKKDLTSHDKIEFEIVLSCYDFESRHRIKELIENGFSLEEAEDIFTSLKKLTISIIRRHRDTLTSCLQDLDRLAVKRKVIIDKCSRSSDPYIYLNGFLKTLEHIIKYGTPQFAFMARQAFIAESLCKSMVKIGLFSQIEMDKFMESISTVASRLETDLKSYLQGKMSKTNFIKKYGHLRSGTYDITASRYDRIKDGFLSLQAKNMNVLRARKKEAKFSLDEDRLRLALAGSDISFLSAKEILNFIVSSIRERENFKFEFTKSLSWALEFLAEAGRLLGFSREDLAFLDLPAIKSYKLYHNRQDLQEFWRALINEKKAQYCYYSMLVLPCVIQSRKDFEIVSSLEGRPNFITQGCISARVVNLDLAPSSSVKNKIVLLTRADPGFDWIFAADIKGLITKYGGAASHMAIRSAEFNIPAAIGCGDKIYNRIAASERLKLDCRSKRIEQF